MPGAAAVRAAHNKAKEQRAKSEAKAEAAVDELRAARGLGPASSSSNAAPRLANVASLVAQTGASTAEAGKPRPSWSDAARKLKMSSDEFRASAPAGDGPGSSCEPSAVEFYYPSGTSPPPVSGKKEPASTPPSKKEPLGAHAGVTPVGFFKYKPQVFALYNNNFVQVKLRKSGRPQLLLRPHALPSSSTNPFGY